ncbi:MAG: hypothetical protein ACC645_20655, partial [Pirellulales bacterium]
QRLRGGGSRRVDSVRAKCTPRRPDLARPMDVPLDTLYRDAPRASPSDLFDEGQPIREPL